MEKVDVKEEMEEEPLGRMMGMEGPQMQGRDQECEGASVVCKKKKR
jgi:hypothetical protein